MDFNINEYITSTRSATKNSEGWVIKPSNGKLSLDLKDFISYDQCELIFKRISGNGKLLINSNSLTVLSKVSQSIIIDITKNKLIEIIRTDESIGDIILIKANLKNQSENIEVNQSFADLKNILFNLNTSLISIAGEKIIASGGATIDNGILINSIVTKPPNAVTIGEKVIFNTTCEILAVILRDDTIYKKQGLSDILQKASGSSLSTPPNLLQSNIYKVDDKYKQYYEAMNQPIQISLANVAFRADVVINPDSTVLMKHTGRLNIPTSNITPFVNYMLNVRARKISGNGKLAIQIKNKHNVVAKKIFLCSHKDTNESLVFSFPGHVDPEDPYEINIYRPEGGASGDIVIESIKFNRCDTIALGQTLSLANASIVQKPVIRTGILPYVSSHSKASILSAEDSWKLSVPKVAHFYWGGDLSFLRYVSLYSFIKHNPDWKVKLHMPEVVGNFYAPWKTGEQQHNINIEKKADNYIERLNDLNIEIIKHNFENYGFLNTEHEVHKSDFIRWKLLGEEGGLWSDFDIIYTHPMFFAADNLEKNKHCNTFICGLPWSNSKGLRSHAIGYMMSSGNNPFFTELFNKVKLKFNKREYQSIGALALNKYVDKLPKTNVLYLNVDDVYSINDNSIDKYLSQDLYIQDYTSAIGFHWYGGSSVLANVESTMNHTNYHTYNNFIGKLVRYTMQ